MYSQTKDSERDVSAGTGLGFTVLAHTWRITAQSDGMSSLLGYILGLNRDEIRILQ
jgi:hypothetical protein